MTRTLRLNREALTELATSDLESVVGAYPPQPTPPVYAPTKVCPISDCVVLTTFCATTG